MGYFRDKRNSSKNTSPCADLRVAYHNCFNRWYSEKFLKGHWDREECVSEWEKYKDCLSASQYADLVDRMKPSSVRNLIFLPISVLMFLTMLGS